MIPEEDRIELAFRRIDMNNDGFITWDEFVQYADNVDPVQAKRIFQTCDNVLRSFKKIHDLDNFILGWRPKDNTD